MTYKILRLPELKTLTGMGRSTIYSKIAQGKFPAPIRLGERSVGWLETDVQDWIEQRIQVSKKHKEELYA